MRKMNLGAVSTPSAYRLPPTSFTRSELTDLTTGTSSKGNQKKYRTVDGRFYVKELFNYDGKMWRDDLVEVIASTYAGMCHLPTGVHVVKQGLCDIDGRLASYSESFLRDGFEFIPYRRARKILLSEDGQLCGTCDETAEQVIAECSDILGGSARDLIHAMFFLDYVVCNEDRHLDNFGFLCGTDGSIEFCPLFDFGLGLFECGSEYDSNKENMCFPTIRLKPCWFPQTQLIEYLLDNSAILSMPPKWLCLQDFQFPSDLAKNYFVWANERLGVKIV